MKIIQSQDNQYVLKLNRGEELIKTIQEFCKSEKITGGFFVGLGASSELTLAYYNLETKKYQETEFNQMMEVASLTGNIAMLDDQMIIHVHGTFAGESLTAVAGHVSRLVVGGACEIKFDKFHTPLNREHDPETGLNLLK